MHGFGGSIENAVTEIEKLIADVTEPAQRRWFAVKLFERDSKVQARFTLGKDVQDKIEKLITAVEEELDDDAESLSPMRAISTSESWSRTA